MQYKNQVQNYKPIILKVLIGFLILMIALTIFSRAADSLTIATVEVENAKRGSLTHRVSGNGTIEATNEIKIISESGFYINDIYVKEGVSVNKGDKLISLDSSDLEDKIFSSEMAVKNLMLQMQELDLAQSNEIQSKTISLERAKNELTSIEQNFELKIQRAEDDLKLAQQDVIKAQHKLALMKNDNEEKQLGEANDAYNVAVEALEEQKYQKEKGLKDLQFNIDDAQKELDDIEAIDKVSANNKLKTAKQKYDNTENDWSKKLDSTNESVKMAYDNWQNVKAQYEAALAQGDEDNIQALQGQVDIYWQTYNTEFSKVNDINKQKESALKEVKKTVDDAKTELDIDIEAKKVNAEAKLKREIEKYEISVFDYDRRIKKAEEDIVSANETLNKIKKGGFNDSAISAIENSIESLERVVIEKQRAIDDIPNEKEKEIVKTNQIIEDSELNLQKEEEIILGQNQKDDIQKNKYLIEISLENKKLEQLKKVHSKGGIITAPSNGIIKKIDTTIGRTTTGEALLIMFETETAYCLKTKIDKEEAKYIQVGDEAELTLAGETKALKGSKVEIIKNLTGEDSGKVEISLLLPEGEGEIGMSALMQISKQTEKYETIIPIQGLRNSSKDGDYILVTSENNTILGQQMVAQKITVKKLDSDSSYVAISGAIGSGDKIIVSSNKNIIAGDRIRLNVQ